MAGGSDFLTFIAGVPITLAGPEAASTHLQANQDGSRAALVRFPPLVLTSSFVLA